MPLSTSTTSENVRTILLPKAIAVALLTGEVLINEGDKVKVDTEKGDYIERIKD